MMTADVLPFDQWNAVPPDAVSESVPPWQKVVAPLAEIPAVAPPVLVTVWAFDTA